MERLASRLPLDLIRSLDDPEDIHALLVGLAGLADPRLFGDDLTERFETLAKTHALPRPMLPEAWRHGGRPANAPRRRLAQAAAMLSASGGEAGLLRREPLARLRSALGTPEPAERLRAMLRASVIPSVRGLGHARADVTLVNAVLPALFLDAEMREDLAVELQALAVFDEMPPEDDHVTRSFADAGLAPENALKAQGVHQLASAYCEEGRCGRCAIGQRLYPGMAQAQALLRSPAGVSSVLQELLRRTRFRRLWRCRQRHPEGYACLLSPYARRPGRGASGYQPRPWGTTVTGRRRRRTIVILGSGPHTLSRISEAPAHAGVSCTR